LAFLFIFPTYSPTSALAHLKKKGFLGHHKPKADGVAMISSCREGKNKFMLIK